MLNDGPSPANTANMGTPPHRRVSAYRQGNLLSVQVTWMPRPDFLCEHRAEPIPPKTDGFVADIDAALVQQVLDIPQRQRKSDIQHHRQADDLWAGFKIAEWAAICHPETLLRHPARFNQV